MYIYNALVHVVINNIINKCAHHILQQSGPEQSGPAGPAGRLGL